MILSRMAPILVCAGLTIPRNAAAQGTVQALAPECTTRGTNWGGSGNDCYSRWQELRAPAGFVFSKDSLTGTEERNGRNNRCEVSWSEEREVIPGIKQPTVVAMRAHVLSPGGMDKSGARGWTKCNYTVNLVRIPG